MMYKLFIQFKFATVVPGNLILIGYECDQSQFAYRDDNDFKAERVF